MYSIRLSKQASKFLASVSKKDQQKIAEKINELSVDPRKEGVIKLVNTNPNTYRIRQGDYRIRFHIHDKLLIIDVIEIEHRKNSYR